MPSVAELRQRFAVERQQREAAALLPLPHMQPGNTSIAPIGPKPPPLPESCHSRCRRGPLASHNNNKALHSVGVREHPDSRIETPSPFVRRQPQAPVEQTYSSHACVRLHDVHHPSLVDIHACADSDPVSAHVEVKVDVPVFMELSPEHTTSAQLTLIGGSDDDNNSIPDCQSVESKAFDTPPLASTLAHQVRVADIKAFMAQRFRDGCTTTPSTGTEEPQEHQQPHQQQHTLASVADMESEDTIHNPPFSATHSHSRDVVDDDNTHSIEEANLVKSTDDVCVGDSDDELDCMSSMDDIDPDFDGCGENDDDNDAESSADSASDDGNADDGATHGWSVTNNDSRTKVKSIKILSNDREQVIAKDTVDGKDRKSAEQLKFSHGRAIVANTHTHTKKKKKTKKQEHRHRHAALAIAMATTTNNKKAKPRKSAHVHAHHENTHSSRKRTRRASVPYKRRRKDIDDSSTSDDGLGSGDPAYKTSWVLEALKFMLPPILLLPVFFVIRCFVVIPLRACGRALKASTRPLGTMCGVLFRTPMRVGRLIRRLVGRCWGSVVSLLARVLNRMLCRKPRQRKRKPSLGRLLVRVITSFGRYCRATFSWVLYSPMRLKRALARTGRGTRLFMRENWEEVLDVLAALAGFYVLIGIFIFIVVPCMVKLGVLSFWGLHLFGLGKFYAAIGVVEGPNILEQWLYRV